MTKCKWKFKFLFMAGIFAFSFFFSSSVVYAAIISSNSEVAKELKDFKKKTLATDQEKAQLKKEYDEARGKCGKSLENAKLWTKVKAFQQFDLHWYAISAEFNSVESFLDLGKYASAIGNLLDSDWENMEGMFSGFLNTLEDIGEQIEYYHNGALKNAKTEKERKNIDEQYQDIKAKYDELLSATSDVRAACETLNSYDPDLVDSIDGKLHKYIYCPGSIDYQKEPDKCSVTYFIYEGEGDNTAKTVRGNMRGCIPLPAKLNEGKSCIFCPLFLKIFNAANTMATQSYGILAISLANVMLIGFAIWIAFSVLGKVSSFTKMDAPKYITELLTQVFKVLLAYLLLRDANAIYTYALGPLLKAGMEFGMTLLSGSNRYLDACKSLGIEEMPLDGLLPSYLYVQLECFIQAVQAELAVSQAVGSSLMCVARNAGKVDDILSVPIPDFSMLLEGLIIWVFAWLLALAFAFYLVDATVRLGIVGALMPFLIACWPFKVTSKYTTQGFTMFMNTFFTYAFMGLVVSINIQLINASMTGVPGGMNTVMVALNGNNVKELQDILDIGFSGFLILIACCIFGFKLCMQVAELAGSMAGPGGGSPIAPKIGTLGYQAASNLALGTAKKVGQGAKLAGSFVGTATGITEKVRKGRDKVVGKMQNFFSFGRSGGGSSAPTSRVRGGSGSPAPQGAPSASDNNTPISADQRQQADNVSNAGPRSAQGQRADNTGRQNANAQQRQQSNNMQGQQPHGASGQQHSGNAQDQQHGSNSQQQARQTQDQNEADRQRRIDEHNRTMAATADVAASAAGKEIQTRRDEAAQKSRAAAERARVFESNAKAELEAAAELRKKAQAAATETERNDLSRQAQQAEDRAQHNTQAAQSERRTEKEQDVRSKAAQTEFDQLVEERKETISPEEVDQRCTEMYGEGYREEQNRTFK